MQVAQLMEEAKLMRQQLLDVQNESNEAIDLKAQLAALKVHCPSCFPCLHCPSCPSCR